jgi:dUTP pyrophosphatase
MDNTSGFIARPYWKIAPLRDSSIVPSKELGNSGYDVYTTQEEDVMILPNERHQFLSGLAMEITPEWGIFFWEKGGFGDKNLSMRAGLTDSNYRGELFILVSNLNPFPVIYTRDPGKYKSFSWKHQVMIVDMNKAITQIVLLPTPHVEPTVCKPEELSVTNRGTGSKGSTGK